VVASARAARPVAIALLVAALGFLRRAAGFAVVAASPLAIHLRLARLGTSVRWPGRLRCGAWRLGRPPGRWAVTALGALRRVRRVDRAAAVFVTADAATVAPVLPRIGWVVRRGPRDLRRSCRWFDDARRRSSFAPLVAAGITPLGAPIVPVVTIRASRLVHAPCRARIVAPAPARIVLPDAGGR
jgi:hypothetical protein